MAWGRIDDTFYRHRKTLALSEAQRGNATALFWLAISWSNDQLADGVVTMATVRLLGFDREVAAELNRVGFWEAPAPDVWQIHDYPVYNKLRAQILAERAAEAARQAEWRKAHPDRKPRRRVSHRDTGRDQQRDTGRDNSRDTHGDTQPVSLARPVSRSPVPVHPSPDQPPPPPAKRGRRADGTNERALGDNPRALGEAPRQLGESTRQERDALKRGPTALGEILLEVGRRTRRGATNGNGQTSIEDLLS